MNVFDEHFPKIEFLLRHYSLEHRTSVQPFRYEMHIQTHPDYVYNIADLAIRESLIEHVGMLPILATYMHAHLKTPVNLGRTLELLAVHDIGEIVTGDESVFTKKQQDEAEKKAALNLLSSQHHSAYLEFKALTTDEAKFAKSIDKMAPDLYDVLTDTDVNAARLKHYAHVERNEIPQLIQKHKSPYMAWDPFIKEFHAGLIKKLEELYIN